MKNNNPRISNSLRNQIGKAFKVAGLDGNGKFDRPVAGLRSALEILESHGLVLLNDLVQGVDGPSGHKTFRLAIHNPAEPESDDLLEIQNSMLVFAWYRRTPEFSDVYDWEVTAYVS